MNHKKVLTAISIATLFGTTSFLFSNKLTHADNTTAITKTVMHNAAIYDKNGKSTGKIYKSYQKVNVESGIVEINDERFYKLDGSDQYIKITNVDGVERKVTHNAYIYATSTKRANNRLVKKGTTIVTYGGSYKFKNGKRYYRVGGPTKQYIKVSNLGSVVNNYPSSSVSNSTIVNTTSVSSTSASNLAPSDGETTITVTEPYSKFVTIYDGNGKVIQDNIKKGTKFIADRREMTKFADQFPPGSITKGFYRIKGTDHWISAANVKATKTLPLHDYNDEHYTYIKFTKPTYLYDVDGNIIPIYDKKIQKQGAPYKVTGLRYIWVPDKNKAELFYQLPIDANMAIVQFGYPDIEHSPKVGYVKADEVKFFSGIKLTPSNTPEQAKATYEASLAK